MPLGSRERVAGGTGCFSGWWSKAAVNPPSAGGGGCHDAPLLLQEGDGGVRAGASVSGTQTKQGSIDLPAAEELR